MVGPFIFNQVQSNYMYRYAQKTLGTTLKTPLSYGLANANNEAQYKILVNTSNSYKTGFNFS